MLSRWRERARNEPGRIELGNVERLVAMRAFPGSSELPTAAISVLASVARPTRLAAGSVLAPGPHALTAVTLVVEGEIVARRAGIAIDRAGPGHAIGAAHAFARDAREVELVAVRDSVILQLSMEDLEDVFEEVPLLLVRAARALARRALEVAPLCAAEPREAGTTAASLPSRALDLVERIVALRRCPAIAGAAIDSVAALANAARELRFAAGEAPWRSRDPARSILVLAAGEMSLDDPDGTSVVLRAGDLAGHVESLAGSARRTDARVVSPVIALEVELDDLFDVWEDHVDLGMEILRDVSAPVAAPARGAA